MNSKTAPISASRTLISQPIKAFAQSEIASILKMAASVGIILVLLGTHWA